MNQATAERMITVGTKDQAMILVRRLFHQFFFMLTPSIKWIEQVIKLSIHAAMNGFKGGFSFYINHSTI